VDAAIPDIRATFRLVTAEMTQILLSSWRDSKL
jgi:hypothetical protein